MTKRLLLALGLAVFASNGIAKAEKRQATEVPVEAFGNLPFISNIQIAPDGKHLAILRRFEDRNVAMIMPRGIEGEVTGVDLKSGIIRNLYWIDSQTAIAVVTESRYVRNYRGTVTLQRLIAIKADGSKNFQMIQKMPWQKSDGIVQQNQYLLSPNRHKDRDAVLISTWTGHSTDIFQASLNSPNAKEIQKGRGDSSSTTTSWMVSPDHESWLRWNTKERSTPAMREVEFRLPGGGWEVIEEYPVGSSPKYGIAGFSPHNDILYVTADRADGPQALFEYDLKSNSLGKMVYADPNIAVGDALIDWKSGKLLGISYTDDEPKFHPLDPDHASLQTKIDKAFKVTSVNRIVSSTEDGTVHIVSISGPNWPEMFFLLDTQNNAANFLGGAYPDLAEIAMGNVEALTYQARDGLDIRAYLTTPAGKEMKALPTIIMPHGGPQSRDTMTFDYMAQFLANRGYAVFQPNYRGSTGYGESFRNAGYGEWGGKMQDDITDGVNHLIEKGIADPQRICILGGSYGGYAALMGAVKTPDLYRCAVSINGVSDLPDMLDDAEHTSADSFWAVSIGTMREDGDKLRAASPARHADRIKAPVLLIHGDDDQTVDFDQSRKMERALKKAKKNVTFVKLKGDDHHLSKGDTRIAALKAVDVFLKKHLGGK